MHSNAKNTILIVDDEPMFITFLIEIFRKDYVLFTAKDVTTALKLASAQSPDLILSDVEMVGETGFDLLSSLQAQEDTKKIPTIFITGRDTAMDEEKGMSLGAVDYILKTARPNVIKIRVQNQIDAINIKRAYLEAVCPSGYSP